MKSCFLSCRANIDEVETEVVEIEAKLDKVRNLFYIFNISYLFSNPQEAFSDILHTYYPCSISHIINWLVRALNADWLTAVVYQTVSQV